MPSVLSMDYEVRKSIYRFLFSGRRLDQETAELFLNQEKTQLLPVRHMDRAAYILPVLHGNG